MQKHGCLAGKARCHKDGARIAFESLQPMGDIGGMIGPGNIGQPKVGTKERRSNLSDQFLGRHVLQLEAMLEAIEPVLCT